MAARVADGLTAVRLLAAVVLVPAVWTARWTSVAVLLSLAWLSDFLDGRTARRAPGETRLGGLDVTADTAVGAALVIGLAGAGTIPWWAAIGAITVLGSLFAAGNLAASMLLQLTGYLPVLNILRLERPSLWWLPYAAIVVIGIADRRRLLHVSIPAFLRGIAGRFEGRSMPPGARR